ncbi:cadherin-15 [Nematolebias whitei]|uniref:cadherin-15 n=1 Tax=Nematolebias whitei TaxID=451745 RepID=UPI001898D8D2|nr:cadherin-15 [Nematolebias whitei]
MRIKHIRHKVRAEAASSSLDLLSSGPPQNPFHVIQLIVNLSFSQVLSYVEQNEEERHPLTLSSWRNPRKDGVRVKRDWIIPQIRVSENSKQVPEDLVQIKSDKIFSGEVIYKLEGPGVDQEPKNLFEIDDKSGVIRSKQPLDREKFRSFTLKAFALSPSGERLENPTTIEIVVLDQNDNRPVFTQKQFSGTVPEFSVPGTSVMSVSAIDADDPMTENAALSYSIVSQESIPANAVTKTMFGINNQTGTIYTRDVGLDREVVQGFKLKLKVADLGGEGLSGDAEAIILVSDINNHPPRFSLTSYSMTAEENVFGVEIGRVNVTDRDDPGTRNWEAKYAITNDPQRNFAVRTDPDTNQGVLTVIRPLDYEGQRRYTLSLTVENLSPLSNKAPNLSLSSATVVVTVVNKNESPVFKENPVWIEVLESAPPGILLKSNLASDPDHSELRYEISKDPEGWLEINRDTGDIVSKRRFNMKSPHVRNNIYTAAVTVTDAGGLSSTAAVKILLKETNDFPPQLVPLSGSVCSRSSSANAGLFLTAVDEDHAPHSAPFTFKFHDDLSFNWTLLHVNDTHAVLRPAVELEAGEYAVTVLVTDSGDPQLGAYAQVNVTVCPCDSFGDCKSRAGALLGSSVGISVMALFIIIACGLEVADNDPNAPPYDTALIYDYEGDGSVAGSLSSIASGSSDEDQDYDYLNDWGPRFQKLADMYDPR